MKGDGEMPKDYGFYGKGLEGYTHYMQAFKESKKGSPGGGGNHQKGNNNGCAVIIGIILIIAVVYIIKALLN